MTKRVIVIGAGTAGLSAIKNALAEGFQVTAYEQWEKLGGLWNYTDKKGVNEHGLPYPYMYRDLRSNGPKETMHFTDFEMISDKSFVSSQEVLKYLNDYTDNFQLRNVIKFQHQVIRVLPIEGERWEVLVKDLATGTYSTETADFVMVCNGHHSRPDWPTIPGQNLFPIEEQRHSCDFRAKEEYTGKRVLVIGSGPSAMDIAVLIGECADTVYLAHRIPFEGDIKLYDNIILTPVVREITANGAIFKDGTSCEVDCILYCIGFKYTFPFLSADCGIFIEENKYVRNVFKHIINVKHPTMAFIGLNYIIISQTHFDMQSQFTVKMWASGKKFPSEREMLKDIEADLAKRLALGWKRRHAHKMEQFLEEYYRELAEFVEVSKVPPVYLRIFERSREDLFVDFLNYRKNYYTVIDDERFERTVGAPEHLLNSLKISDEESFKKTIGSPETVPMIITASEASR